ncbi:type IV pilus modification PilV family protein [Actomonas aquatica]|uniref:Type II secretion system protein n=1 Tax=Actomonas aquatica TaxID=2866162 RepID=A0ABZ1C629_9BACT|nr:type II secretion system protein [Opitutus sp. WL0086]WRQ86782.1 type II secretion system protein [Opitutus sp. WL0086]
MALTNSAASTLGGRPKTRPQGNTAFTLVEVMVAASVLTLALASAIIVLQAGFRNLDTARTATAAGQAMQSEMERIRLLNWSQLNALPASAEINIPATYTSNSIEADRLTITRTVQDVPGFGSPTQMKAIVLIATWTSIDGQPHRRAFQLHYSRNGLFDYYYNAAQS